MKILMLALLTFLLVFSCASTQEVVVSKEEIETMPVIPESTLAEFSQYNMTGNLWNNIWTDGEKTAYVIGYLTASGIANVVFTGSDGDGILTMPLTDVYKVIQLIDYYYTIEENINISIYEVIHVAFNEFKKYKK